MFTDRNRLTIDIIVMKINEREDERNMSRSKTQVQKYFVFYHDAWNVLANFEQSRELNPKIIPIFHH